MPLGRAPTGADRHDSPLPAPNTRPADRPWSAVCDINVHLDAGYGSASPAATSAAPPPSTPAWASPSHPNLRAGRYARSVSASPGYGPRISVASTANPAAVKPAATSSGRRAKKASKIGWSSQESKCRTSWPAWKAARARPFGVEGPASIRPAHPGQACAPGPPPPCPVARQNPGPELRDRARKPATRPPGQLAPQGPAEAVLTDPVLVVAHWPYSYGGADGTARSGRRSRSR